MPKAKILGYNELKLTKRTYKNNKKRFHSETESGLKTPTSKRSKPASTSHSPYGKIYLKLPLKFKKAYKKKLFEEELKKKKSIQTPTVNKKEVKTKTNSDMIKDALETFDFIESFNSRHFVLRCSEYQPLFIRKEGELKRYPGKSKMKQIQISFDCLSSSIDLLRFLVTKKCLSLTNPISLNGFLEKLLLKGEKPMKNGEYSFEHEFYFNLANRSITVLSVINEVRIKFLIFVKVYNYQRNRRRLQVSIHLDPHCMIYIYKEDRDDILLQFFILSIFLEHYLSSFIRSYPKELSKLGLNSNIFSYFRSRTINNDIKTYIIPIKARNLTEKEIEFNKLLEKEVGSPPTKVKKISNKIDNELSLKIQTIEQSKIKSSHFFDIYNCSLPFSFPSLITKRPLSVCSIDLKEIIRLNKSNKLSFLPNKSTSRLSLIQTTRMKQVGVRLGYCELSPLLFRIELKPFKIDVKTLHYLHLHVQHIILNSMITCIKLQTTPSSTNDDISHKRFINSWKVYLDFHQRNKQTNDINSIIKDMIHSIIQIHQFPFVENISLKNVKGVYHLKEWFIKNGNFISLHFKLYYSDIDHQITLKPILSTKLNNLREADIKFGFLLKRTYGHDKTKLFVRKAYENVVSFHNISEIEASILFSLFLEKAEEQWENNNFIRFDIFISQNKWNEIKQKTWLKEQLQVVASIVESHMRSVFRKWALSELLKQVMNSSYKHLQDSFRYISVNKSLNMKLNDSLKELQKLELQTQNLKNLDLEKTKVALNRVKQICLNVKQSIRLHEIKHVIKNIKETILVEQSVHQERYFFEQWKINSNKERNQNEISSIINEMIHEIESKYEDYSLFKIYQVFSDERSDKSLNNFLETTLKYESKEEAMKLLTSFRTNSSLDIRAPCVFTPKRDSFELNTVGYDILNKKLLNENELIKLMQKSCCDELNIIDWCFDPCFGVPSDYKGRQSDVVKLADGSEIFKTGVRTFLGVYTNDEFNNIEDETDSLYELSKNSRSYQDQIRLLGIDEEALHKEGEQVRYFNDNTAHHLFNKRRCIRTKMFFNYRYLWTKEEMKHKDSKIANGIRSDPSKIPKWMLNKVQNKLIEKGIIKPRLESVEEVKQVLAETINLLESRSLEKENGFKPIEMNVNSFAVNIYHDGSIGLSQHFDDSKRFRANIVSMRLYSDSRLSFDCKGFGCVNGKFTVDMPRGSLQVLNNDSYAGKQVTHCIRPGDMMGKSGVLLLREIQPRAMKEANSLFIRQANDAIEKLTIS